MGMGGLQVYGKVVADTVADGALSPPALIAITLYQRVVFDGRLVCVTEVPVTVVAPGTIDQPHVPGLAEVANSILWVTPTAADQVICI